MSCRVTGGTGVLEKYRMKSIMAEEFHDAGAETVTYVPGMREQGEGIKCYIDSAYAPLKACMVGNPTSVHIPDLSTWEIQNLYAHSPDEVKAYLRKYGGKDMKAVGHDTYRPNQESSPCSV